MHIVVQLVGRIYACQHVEGGFLAGGVAGVEEEGSLGLQILGEVFQREKLRAVKPEVLGVLALHKLQGENAHADEVGAVDTLKAFGHHHTYTQEARPFGRPVPAGACAIFRTGEDKQRCFLLSIAHGGLINAHGLPGGQVNADTPFAAWEEQVFKAYIGKSTAHHNLMVAAPCAIGVKVPGVDAVVHQILGCGAVFGNVARGGNMVRRHRVTQQRQSPGIHNVLEGCGGGRNALEEGGLSHIGGGFVPNKGVAFGHFEGLPECIALEGLGIAFLEIFRFDGGGNGLLNFLIAGPNVLEEDGPAVAACADSLRTQIHVDVAVQGEGNHQGGRGQEIQFHLWVYTSLKVAVAREHGGDIQVAFGNGLQEGLGEGARVADAGGAAEARHMEAQGFQIGEEAGLAQIVNGDLGAGGEGGFHPGLGDKPLLHSFFGQEARGEQHRGVGSVGTRRNGSNNNAPVLQLKALLFLLYPRGGGRGRGEGRGSGFEFGQGDVVLWAGGAGEAGDDGGQVQLQGVGEEGLMLGAGEEALVFAEGFDNGHIFFAAACEAQIFQGTLVNGEEAHGSAILGGHVGDGGPVRERQGVHAGAEKLDKLADDAFFAQHLCEGEDSVGGRGPLGQLAFEAHAHHLGNEHADGLSQHGGFGLNTAHPPAQNPQAVNHGGMRVCTDEAVAIELLVGPEEGHLCEVFEVDLVANAGVRGDGAEVLEGFLAPFEEGIALLVSFKLEGDVVVEGPGGAEEVHHDGVVNDQVHGAERVNFLRVFPHGRQGFAHGGQVHNARHPRKILQQHAGGGERNFCVVVLAGGEGQEGLHMLSFHNASVLKAQEVFEEDFEGEGEFMEVWGEFGKLGEAMEGEGFLSNLQFLNKGGHGGCFSLALG